MQNLSSNPHHTHYNILYTSYRYHILLLAVINPITTSYPPPPWETINCPQIIASNHISHVSVGLNQLSSPVVIFLPTIKRMIWIKQLFSLFMSMRYAHNTIFDYLRLSSIIFNIKYEKLILPSGTNFCHKKRLFKKRYIWN